MRQLSHRLQRDRLALRSRPRPRWLRPLQYGATMLAAVGILAGSLHRLDRTGILGSLRDRVVDGTIRLSGSGGLVVRDVYAEGRGRTSEAEIVGALARYQGRDLLAVDLLSVKQRLEALPWVREATVIRQFPDTLVGRVVEHRPVAVWQHGVERRLLGSEGEVIPVRDLRAFSRLPVLAGPDAPARAGELFAALASEPELARRVTQAVLVGQRRWSVWLDHRIEVRLPETAMEEAWQFLAKRQRETSLLARAVEVIDLRRADWLVVRLLGEPTMPSAATDHPA